MDRKDDLKMRQILKDHAGKVPQAPVDEWNRIQMRTVGAESSIWRGLKAWWVYPLVAGFALFFLVLFLQGPMRSSVSDEELAEFLFLEEESVLTTEEEGLLEILNYEFISES